MEGLAVILAGGLVVHHQLVFGLGGGLQVVGYFGDLAFDDEVPAVGVGGGYLRIARLFELLLEALVFLLPLAELLNGLLHFVFPGVGACAVLLAVGLIELCQVFVQLAVDILYVFAEFVLVEVVLFGIDCAELGAVNGHQVCVHEAEIAAHEHEVSEGIPQCLGVVCAEIGDGAVLRPEALHQPHGFYPACRQAGFTWHWRSSWREERTRVRYP